MQLRNARLCLDCEEVHESQQCPLCASETFVFMTRWVPVPERRQKPRSPEPPPSPEALDSYRELLGAPADSAGWRFVKRGAVGLALFGVASLVFRKPNEQKPHGSASDTQARNRQDDEPGGRGRR
jgi:hypothetical protein